jgi:hypothetical protein
MPEDGFGCIDHPYLSTGCKQVGVEIDGCWFVHSFCGACNIVIDNKKFVDVYRSHLTTRLICRPNRFTFGIDMLANIRCSRLTTHLLRQSTKFGFEVYIFVVIYHSHLTTSLVHEYIKFTVEAGSVYSCLL